ncbi:unnamed protein product (macronuclear) [Paramecium tetraurelia]|uniref:Uncharacterized protein n=1 Tax=Paramecium tetraurelia TaxID=5888 RepID=A0CC92_PARTE|nr:uncharacterized protein GSPATT00037193001 [Paramecium tetraurelia]CAK68409.1 unnamed protein product [Paramecium tetraurelia]|eukprot:XP_001435806.1 hypothetical protein (macronuclear) [Paramecium tetraurelia strain d4-2]
MGDRQSHQHQAQTYQQKQSQEEALIKFYVYQDLQNLINLIYSRNAVLEHFKDDPNNSIVTLSNNKVILQLNLSIGIHQDLKQQYSRNHNLQQILQRERNTAYQTLKDVTQKSQRQISTSNQTKIFLKDSVENYLNTYTQNYEMGYFGSNQFQLQQTNYAPQFNEQTLSKLISSMQSIDAQTNQIGTNGNYQAPTPEYILQRAQDYYSMTKQKLDQSDPTNCSAQLNNKQENYSQGNNSLTANNIASKQPQPEQYSEEIQLNNKQKSQIIVDKQRNQQSSSNSDQMQLNNKQESQCQGCGSFNTNNRGIQEQLNSSNSEQDKQLINANLSQEKDKLIEFLKLSGYFQQTHPYLNSQIEDLQGKAKTLMNQSYLTQNEYDFAIKLSKQNGVFKLLISLHYYFELFLEYFNENRPSQSIQQFLCQNKNKGKMNVPFLQYLVSKKQLIEKNFDSKNQINYSQASSNQEDFVFEMYKGYCDYYKITRN